MRDYGRVAPTFWTRGSGKKLRGKPASQVVALYLFTCPASTMIGIYHLALPTLAHETGLSVEDAARALADVCALDVARYDADEELVYLPEGARYQIGERLKSGDKRVSGIKSALAQFARHPFALDFARRYAADFCLEAPSEPLPTMPSFASKPLPQEQEAPSKPLPSGCGATRMPLGSQARQGKEQAITDLSPPATQEVGSVGDPAVTFTPVARPTPTPAGDTQDPSGQALLFGVEATPANEKPKRKREPTPPTPVTEVRRVWEAEWPVAGMPGPAPWGAEAAAVTKAYLEAPGASVETARAAILGMLRTPAGDWHRTNDGGRHVTVQAALAGKHVVSFTAAGTAWLETQRAATRPRREPPPPAPIPDMDAIKRRQEERLARALQPSDSTTTETQP